MDSASKPQLLNDRFHITFHNGEDSDPRTGSQNLLIVKNSPPHCTKEGGNFDVVLHCEKGFTLTHFVAVGGINCTAPLKDGLLWVSDVEPKIDAYAAKYNDFTKEQFDAIQRTGSAEEPVLFFSTDEETLEFSHTFVGKWPTGNYVHIKFINRHENGGENVDVQYIGLVGFEGKDKKYEDLGSVPEELHLVTPQPKVFNQLKKVFLGVIQNSPSVIVYSKDEADKAAVEAVADKYKGKIVFFWSDYPENKKAPKRIADFVGMSASHMPCLVGLHLASGSKWLQSGKPITKDSVEAFCNGMLDGSLPKFMKSAARPANDSDPAHPGLKIVVGSTFEEIVLDKTKDVLLDVYADWCGPCRAMAPKYSKVAEILQGIPSIVVAKLNCDFNDTDPKYLPETSIPNVKLFPKGDKDKWIKFNGERSITGLIQFLHQNCSEKFDLDSVLKHPAVIEEKVNKLKGQLQTEVDKINADLNDHIQSLSEGEISSVRSTLEKLNAVLSRDDVQPEELTSVANEAKALDAIKKLSKIAADAEEAAELLALKNVKKIHSDEEFTKIIAETKDKLIAVDFFATWCGPCVMIAPFFADLSEQFKDVLFLKIDVDQQRETSKREGIRAMPTFKFYKNGSAVDTLVGADPTKLVSTIQKHSASA